MEKTNAGMTWDNAQAGAQLTLGKDGKLPEMPVDVEEAAEEANDVADKIQPTLNDFRDAWADWVDQLDQVIKGCDANIKAVQTADFDMDSKDPNQAKKIKGAKAELTNALTYIKGTIVKAKEGSKKAAINQIQAYCK